MENGSWSEAFFQDHEKKPFGHYYYLQFPVLAPQRPDDNRLLSIRFPIASANNKTPCILTSDHRIPTSDNRMVAANNVFFASDGGRTVPYQYFGIAGHSISISGRHEEDAARRKTTAEGKNIIERNILFFFGRFGVFCWSLIILFFIFESNKSIKNQSLCKNQKPFDFTIFRMPY